MDNAIVSPLSSPIGWPERITQAQASLLAGDAKNWRVIYYYQGGRGDVPWIVSRYGRPTICYERGSNVIDPVWVRVDLVN